MTVLTDDMTTSCPICGLHFESKAWAEKCEAWCIKYKSCNIEIIKHVVKE